MKIFNISSTTLNTYLLSFYCIMGLSTIWHFIGLHRAVVFVIFIFFSFLLNNFVFKRKINIILIFISFLILLLASPAAIYWQNFRYLVMPLFFVVTLVSVSLLKYEEIYRATDIITKILFILLILSWVGVVSTYFFNIGFRVGSNPDGRAASFYLTTLSNAGYYLGGRLIIRPSAIYDEPGAFSFIICFVALIRVILNKNDKTTILLLIAGLITLSLAHFIFLLTFLLSLVVKNLKKGNYRIINRMAFAIGGLLLIMYFTGLLDIFNTLLLARADISNVENLGDNRRGPMLNALFNLDIGSFFWGLDPVCISDAVMCSRIYGQVGDNPLGPLVTGGIWISFVYYAVLTVFLILGLTSLNRILFIGGFLLLLQRPLVMSVGYEIYIVLILYLTYLMFNKKQLETLSI